MKVLLSQEELENYCKEHDKGWCNDDCGLCGALAQARHLLKILEEPCPHVPKCARTVIFRRHCEKCMGEIGRDLA